MGSAKKINLRRRIISDSCTVYSFIAITTPEKKYKIMVNFI